jgi:HSP20 family molecular chaperone IbpA
MSFSVMRPESTSPREPGHAATDAGSGGRLADGPLTSPALARPPVDPVGASIAEAPGPHDTGERSRAADECDGRVRNPVTRVHRTDAELTITIELSQVAATRVCVTAEHDVLTVHGTRAPRGSRSESPRDDPRDDPRERHGDGYSAYRFLLPPGVDPASIRSDYADGILAIHVPNPARFRRTVIPVTLPAVRAGPVGDAAPGAASQPRPSVPYDR